jgi:hypothetical protein
MVYKGWRVEGRVESGYVAVGLGLDRSTVSIAGAGGGRVCFVFSPFWSLRISSREGEVSERLKVQDEINKVNRRQHLSIGPKRCTFDRCDAYSPCAFRTPPWRCLGGWTICSRA